jgi:hypothetical protein
MGWKHGVISKQLYRPDARLHRLTLYKLSGSSKTWTFFLLSLSGSALIAPYLANVAHSNISINSDPAKTASSFGKYGPLIHHVPQLISLALTSVYGSGYSDVAHFSIYKSLMRTFTNACPVLRHLEIALPLDNVERDTGGMSRDIANFLLSFSSLTTLVLDMATYELVPKDSILKHSETLERLGVEGHEINRPNSYKLVDLVAIIQACSKLKELAVHTDIPVLYTWSTLCHDLLQPAAGPSIDDVIPIAILVSTKCDPNVETTLWALG